MSPFPLPAPVSAARASRQTLGLMVLSGLVGAALGYTVVHAAVDYLIVQPPEKVWLVYSLPLLPLAAFLAVVGHELGHLAAGVALGGRFLLFIVGPLRVQRTPEGIRFSCQRSFSFAGGLAATQPAATADVRLTMLVVAAAGPLTSVLLSLAGWPLSALLGTWAWFDHSLAWYLLAATGSYMALVSGLIALTALVPVVAQGFKSDGARVWTLLRGQADAVAESALLQLTARYLAGDRPADFPADLVARASGGRDTDLMALMGRLMAYYQAADRRDFASARTLLEGVLAARLRLPAMTRQAVCAEYAWLQIQLGGDVATARAWLDVAGPVTMEPATRHLAAAAILQAEGRRAEAEAEAAAGARALRERSLGGQPNAWLVARLANVLGPDRAPTGPGGMAA